MHKEWEMDNTVGRGDVAALVGGFNFIWVTSTGLLHPCRATKRDFPHGVDYASYCLVE